MLCCFISCHCPADYFHLSLILSWLSDVIKKLKQDLQNSHEAAFYFCICSLLDPPQCVQTGVLKLDVHSGILVCTMNVLPQLLQETTLEICCNTLRDDLTVHNAVNIEKKNDEHATELTTTLVHFLQE